MNNSENNNQNQNPENIINNNVVASSNSPVANEEVNNTSESTREKIGVGISDEVKANEKIESKEWQGFNNSVSYGASKPYSSYENKTEKDKNTNYYEPKTIQYSSQPKSKKAKWSILGFLGCFFSILIFVGLILPAFVWSIGYLPDSLGWMNLPYYMNPTLKSNMQIHEALCVLTTEGSLNYKNLECSNFDKKIDNNSNSSTSKSSNSSSSSTSSMELLPSNLDDLKKSEKSLVDLVASVEDSIVTVVATSQVGDNYFLDDSSENSQNIGSGFVIRQDGLIVTNSHVVADESLSYSVIIKNESSTVVVDKIYRDPTNDIAFLKINKSNLRPIKLADSDLLKKGQFAMAVGSPLGDLTGTVTTGIISGLNRDVTAGDSYSSSTKKFLGVIQTDAAINPGNSGGPLINSSGEVIGINFATSRGDNNISFALPINRVKLKLKEFEKYGRFLQPYIGVSIQQGRYYSKTEVLYGALVSKVSDNSPASAAGIKAKDLILKVDGEEVVDKPFQQIIQSKNVGDKIKLEIWRNGEKLTIEVEVKDRAE